MDHPNINELIINLSPHRTNGIHVILSNDKESYTSIVNENKAIFKGVEFGDYTITITDDKYENFSGNITLNKSGPTEFNINLIPVKRTLHLLLPDKSRGLIMTVTNEDGSFTGIVDDNNEVLFNDLTPGKYTITITDENYENYTQEITITKDTPSIYDLNIDLVREKRTVQLAVAPTEAIGVTVTLANDDETYTATVNSDNKAIFTDVVLGKYTVSVNDVDYEDYSSEITLNKSTPIVYESSITLRKAIRNVQINITPETNEELTVKLAKGEEVYSTTTTSGTATFENIKFGTWTITVESESYDTYTQDILINANNSNPRIVDINIVRSTRKIQLNLSPSATKGVLVVLSDGTEEYNATVDENNKAIFNNIPTGSYTITIDDANYEDFTKTITLNKSTPATYEEDITLTGVVRNVKLKVNPPETKGITVKLNRSTE